MSTSITTFYIIAIALYLVATLFFGNTIRDKHSKSGQGKSGTYGIVLTIIGFASHIVYFILRWIAGGHAPVSNMFEFVTFLGISIVLAFIILYFIYRADILGLFALPIALIILDFVSIFPTALSHFVSYLNIFSFYFTVYTI